MDNIGYKWLQIYPIVILSLPNLHNMLLGPQTIFEQNFSLYSNSQHTDSSEGPVGILEIFPQMLAGKKYVTWPSQVTC